MSQDRKTVARGPDPGWTEQRRPLGARSVVASTLLGMEPPRMAGRMLVRSGSLFGIAEGATRTALSRMVAAGELEWVHGDYVLAGGLAERHARQGSSRRAERDRWTGAWEMVVVSPGARSAVDRADLRAAVSRLKLAELREGVWLRPDNLDHERLAAAQAIVGAQCERFDVAPRRDARTLAAGLWDLDAWATEARSLRAEMRRGRPRLDRDDASVLASTFVVAAAVLRHMLADPLLPDELLPARWPGIALRRDYELYDAGLKRVWRAWFREQRVDD